MTVINDNRYLDSLICTITASGNVPENVPELIRYYEKLRDSFIREYQSSKTSEFHYLCSVSNMLEMKIAYLKKLAAKHNFQLEIIPYQYQP